MSLRHAPLFAAIILTLVCLEPLDAQVKKSGEAAEDAGQFTKLFDGTSLKGWEGNLDWFRVKDGAIIAGSLKKNIPNNEFLCTEKKYKDFELKLKAKHVGEGNNAGIQFRSIRIPNHHEMIGFQCDIGVMQERLIWGSLYDESRRRKFLAHGDAEEVKKAFRSDDWNEFRIRCEGKRIQIWLNDVQTVDYTETDDDIADSGLIGLQVHSGKPAEAMYKDIEIRELEASKEYAQDHFATCRNHCNDRLQFCTTATHLEQEDMTQGKRPEFIYFDLGNVLLLFDHEIAAAQMSELSGVSVDAVRELVFENSLQHEYETGTISTAGFYEHFCRETGSRPDLEKLLAAASEIFELNHPIVPVVAQLAATGIPLGVLSNTCDAHWRFVKRHFYLLDQFFPVNALSFHLKSMKPDASIYEQAARLANVDPSNIFFTDDREENVAGAIAAGFDAVHFTNVKTLVADLAARGVAINY